jgi:ribosomal protein S27E
VEALVTAALLLWESIRQLTQSWQEHIEYGVMINQHPERRGRTITHPSLLDQLDAASKIRAAGQRGGGSSRPGPRMPGNAAALLLASEIRGEAVALHDELHLVRFEPEERPLPRHRHTKELVAGLSVLCHAEPCDEVEEVAKAARSWVHRARLLLGHDAPTSALRDTVCGECGGALVVAADASTAVRCAGTPDVPPCGVRYERHDWIRLAEEAGL